MIRLGQELSKLTQEHAISITKFKPYWDGHQKLFNDWYEQNPNAGRDEKRDAYNRLREESGLVEMEKGIHPDDVMECIAPVADAILAIPATSWAGVLVKAQLARFGASNFWDEKPEDLDWDQIVMRNLCDAVIDMAARTAVQIAAS